jgi:hypothetical protein
MEFSFSLCIYIYIYMFPSTVEVTSGIRLAFIPKSNRKFSLLKTLKSGRRHML